MRTRWVTTAAILCGLAATTTAASPGVAAVRARHVEPASGLPVAARADTADHTDARPSTSSKASGAKASGASESGPALRIRFDRSGALHPGSPLAYTIRISARDHHRHPAAVVNQLLPAGVAYASATPAPRQASAESLQWTVDVPANQEVRLQVRGSVVPASALSIEGLVGSVGASSLATTACVAPDASSKVSGCATAIGRVSPNVAWWRSPSVLAGFAILLVLVMAGFVLVLVRRPRRVVKVD